MTTSKFIIATAALGLLAGCNQNQAEAPPAEKPAAEAAQPDAATTGILTSLTATPLQKADAARIMKERHDGMEKVGKTMKQLSRAVKADPLDMGAVKAGAATMAGLSAKAAGWFPAGTGPDVGKTGAKPEIWQQPKDFAAKLKGFQTAANKFNAAAKGGDAGAIKASLGELGNGCKSCHDSYRSKMKH